MNEILEKRMGCESYPLIDVSPMVEFILSHAYCAGNAPFALSDVHNLLYHKDAFGKKFWEDDLDSETLIDGMLTLERRKIRNWFIIPVECLCLLNEQNQAYILLSSCLIWGTKWTRGKAAKMLNGWAGDPV